MDTSRPRTTGIAPLIPGLPHMKQLILTIGVVVLWSTNLMASDAADNLAAIAELTLRHQPNMSSRVAVGEPVFGSYLGSGDGEAAGALSGRIGWDLYEDQTRPDTHPTLFRGVIESGGKTQGFEIIGVFTEVTTQGSEELQRWAFSGAIFFESTALIGRRHAAVTGEGVYRAPGVWRHRYTVWGNPR